LTGLSEGWVREMGIRGREGRRKAEKWIVSDTRWRKLRLLTKVVVE
jgi:hypothetical protein